MNAVAEFLNFVPLWALFLLTTALCVGEVEIGTALARVVLHRRGAKEPEAPLGSLVGAMLGLLAFMLAFTFGLAANRFDSRRQLVLDEANAVGTTYLRAALLPQPQQGEVRRLLREYVEVRLGGPIGNLPEVVSKSEALHDALWAQTKSLAAADMDGELRSLFVKSLNETIDLHQSRVTVGMQYQVPGIVWLAMYLLTSLTMLAVGYQIGNAGARRLHGMPIVAAAFALVMTLIADIDRPGEGFIGVSQQPIADTYQMMKRNSP